MIVYGDETFSTAKNRNIILSAKISFRLAIKKGGSFITNTHSIGCERPSWQ